MPTETTVEAPAGAVTGAQSGGITAFLGVPFALPPTGERRFRAPERHPRWGQPFTADRFGNSPVQERSPYTAGMQLSEDCLSINIWVPEGAVNAPVLLWIYGGGFAGGSSAIPIFDGARLAEETGVIVVSANHRTGALGFATLTHRGLPDASNLGLQDVASALEWVTENITSFGGDPTNVTVMGQSSGAFIAAALLAIPSARDLMAKLILISGGASRILPQKQAEGLGDQFIKAAGVTSGPALHGVSTDEIVHAQRQVGSHEIGARNAPVPNALGIALDSQLPKPVLPEHPMEVLRAGKAARIPILFVVTGAEVASLRGPDREFVPPNADALIREIASWGAPEPERIVSEYGDSALGVKREQILTDFIYRLPAARAAMAQNVAGGRAWVAQVDEPDGSAASHSLPAQILFGNVPDDDPLATLSRTFRGVLSDFVKTGDTAWAPFGQPDAEVMHIGNGAAPVGGDFASLLRCWEGIDRP